MCGFSPSLTYPGSSSVHLGRTSKALSALQKSLTWVEVHWVFAGIAWSIKICVVHLILPCCRKLRREWYFDNKKIAYKTKILVKISLQCLECSLTVLVELLQEGFRDPVNIDIAIVEVIV